MQITLGTYGKVKTAVNRKGIQHMVKKADAAGTLESSGSVQI
jgi:hypothetical protein